jgi:formylglycine-generating enzyme required for sulfatase activity
MKTHLVLSLILGIIVIIVYAGCGEKKSEYGVGSIWTRPADGMVMVYVPAGKFLMGSIEGDITQALQMCSSDPASGDFGNEKPQHTVSLDAFWIDQTEVTNKMYALCVAVGKCDPPELNNSSTRTSYYGNPEFVDYPVTYVSWNDAIAYCEWVGARLPSEAEWEKAARGTDGHTYPWGEGIDCQKANYHGCVGDTSRVGSFEEGKSLYGAYDMAGNVWEWVADLYDVYPGGDPNTIGFYVQTRRVQRGGSWNALECTSRSAYRAWSIPDAVSITPHEGFRCARMP